MRNTIRIYNLKYNKQPASCNGSASLSLVTRDDLGLAIVAVKDNAISLGHASISAVNFGKIRELAWGE